MTITVTQLGNFLRTLIDGETMLFDIQVKGEVANFNDSFDAVYFSLKDESSSIDCFMFKNLAKTVLKNGEVITIKGKPNYLVKSGRMSFSVNKIIKEDNLSESYKQFLVLKDKLEKQGYFSNSREINRYAKRIGVVSSPSGAVIKDIITVIKRRNPTVDIVLYPVRVQGINAPSEIAKGIRFFSNTNVETVIVARGGGSQEDLAAFNTIEVVEATYSSLKPVISAVGHETNTTLIDMAADLRAATPSVAAELATIELKDFILSTSKNVNKIYNILTQKLQYSNELLTATAKYIVLSGENIYAKSQSNVLKLSDNLTREIFEIYNKTNASLNKQIAILDANNPLKLLKQGYATVTINGKKVINAMDLKTNDLTETYFTDGIVTSKIIKIDEVNR